MKISRFFAAVTFFAALALAPLTVFAADGKLPAPERGEDGLYKQSWFLESFLDLREDQKEAAEANKHYMVIWEQRGCPYCKRTHEVNYRIPEVTNYIKKHFNVVQLNLWGDKEVTDFDGQTAKEKEIARKWGIRFTPTMMFFSGDPKEITKEPGNKQDVMRVPGYFKPFHFTMLHKYVKDGAYKTEPEFQRWVIAEGDKLREHGIDINNLLWSDGFKLKLD